MNGSHFLGISIYTLVHFQIPSGTSVRKPNLSALPTSLDKSNEPFFQFLMFVRPQTMKSCTSPSLENYHNYRTWLCWVQEKHTMTTNHSTCIMHVHLCDIPRSSVCGKCQNWITIMAKTSKIKRKEKVCVKSVQKCNWQRLGAELFSVSLSDTFGYSI